MPGTLSPEGPLGVNSPEELEIIIELKQGDPLEQVLLGVEDLEIVDGISASIPYLIVSDEGFPRFFENLGRKDVIRFPFRKGNDGLVSDETETACHNTQEKQRQGDPIKAYPVCLHGRDFVMPGEGPQAKKGGHQDAEGEDLKSNARNLIQVIEEDERWGGPVFEEGVHSSEKIDDEVDENEGAHAEEQYLEEFPADISLKGVHCEPSLTLRALDGGLLYHCKRRPLFVKEIRWDLWKNGAAVVQLSVTHLIQLTGKLALRKTFLLISFFHEGIAVRNRGGNGDGGEGG